MFKFNEIYRKLFEGSNDAIFVLNTDGIFVDCNIRAQKMLERTKEEIIGKTPIDLSPEFQPDGGRSSGLVPQLNNAALQGNEQRFDWVFMKKGIEFPVEVSVSKVTEDDETFLYGVVKDLTELRLKERQLKESEERFRMIFNQSADGVLLYDPNAGFVDCNASALRLLNIKTKEKLVGIHPWQISPSKQPDGFNSKERVIEANQRCLKHGQHRLDWIFSRKDKKVWYDVVLTKVELQQRTLIHVIMRDISEKKKYEETLLQYQDQLEDLVKDRTYELQLNEKELIRQHKELESALKELKEAQDQLIRSEKMASLGILSAGVGHEINNPLNYIQGGIEGLTTHLEEKYKNEDPVINKFLEIIYEGIMRVSSIVNSLSQYSRITTNMDEECFVNDILDNCLNILRGRLMHIAVEKHFTKTNTCIKGNAGRLHQAFMNIISNAEQATSKRGNIAITTKNKKKSVDVIISDDGEGISEIDLPRIMDPFYTTKSPGKGTGLGLSITYKIIEEHGGTINVKSTLRQGTTFKISLPKKKA